MVSIHTLYEGGLRCRSTHGPSGTTLCTDAPVDNHGRGESFSPTDLVATALGSCMVTVMGIHAQKRGWDVSGTTVDVVKHMTSEGPRRIARLEVMLRVAGEHDEEARALLERVARSCPVFESIHPDIEVPVTFHWKATADA